MNLKQAAAAVGWIAALLPAVVAGAQSHSSLSPAEVDHTIRVEWLAKGIVPAAPADDARFLRRAYLDILGTIPQPEVVLDFLADKSPDKRAKAVSRMLDSPKYADQWTNYWYDILMGRQVKGQALDQAAFRTWLHTQFDNNVPWNKFVYSLITASGQNSTGVSLREANGLMASNDAPETGDAAAINGATNWILKYQGKPEDLSGTASRIFLGVQIQCAQCHNHKTEKWKQTDFRSFTACFINTRPVPVDRAKVKGMVRRVDLEDVNRPFVPRGKKAGDVADYINSPPAALDGSSFTDSPNRRQAIAAWMTARENPWFAEAIVNRMWNHFLGRGFVEPVDDFRNSNPAVMPDLMERIADDFVASGYDLKHLVKLICATQVYQLSSAPAVKSDPQNKLWARYRLKPMGPEQMIDSLVTATNLQPVLEKVAGANLATLKVNIERQFSFLFDVDEEFEQKDFEGTIPQALMLLNGGLVNRSVTPIPGTTLADVLEMPGTPGQKVEALYLRTLSRKPTPAELTTWTTFVNAPREVVTTAGAPQPSTPQRPRRKAAKQGKKAKGAGDFDPLARVGSRAAIAGDTPKGQAYEDLFWALLNSSEFMFNH